MTRPDFKNYIERAESSLRIQRKRSLFFSDSLIFDNPPWELLLEIFIATEQRSCISKRELIDSLDAPNSIVSRWIEIFADRQYLIRCETHDLDCVKLTDKARSKCSAYLDSILEDQL